MESRTSRASTQGLLSHASAEAVEGDDELDEDDVTHRPPASFLPNLSKPVSHDTERKASGEAGAAQAARSQGSGSAGPCAPFPAASLALLRRQQGTNMMVFGHVCVPICAARKTKD